MRDIEGIEKAIKSLKPHLKTIEADFNKENERFKTLMSAQHDLMGRVLKCHLIVEHYLDRFLGAKHHIDKIEDARLTFSQKARLLPNAGSAASFVKPGVLKLNAIRNRFGHRLEAQVESSELGPINEVLKVARPGFNFQSAIDRIEAFTTVACTWLLVAPPHLERVFQKAFSEIQLKEGEIL